MQYVQMCKKIYPISSAPKSKLSSSASGEYRFCSLNGSRVIQYQRFVKKISVRCGEDWSVFSGVVLRVAVGESDKQSNDTNTMHQPDYHTSPGSSLYIKLIIVLEKIYFKEFKL